MGDEHTPDVLNSGPEPDRNLGVPSDETPRQGLWSRFMDWLTGNQQAKTREARREDQREPPAQDV